MNLLTYDISRKGTGVAFGDGDRPKTASFPLPEVEGSNQDGWEYGPTGAAMIRIVSDHIAVIKPDLIAYESPLPPQVFKREVTARLLLGLGFLVEAIASAHGIPCEERNVSSVKLFWTGNGHADKEAMIARCRQLNWPVKSHDEADAAALWSLVRAEHEPTWSLRATPLFGRAPA